MCIRDRNYLILLECGQTKKWFGDLNESDAWQKIEARYPAIAQHLEYYESKAKKRYDQGDYWWELRACAYYDEFEKEKVVVPSITNKPNFTIDKRGHYSNDKTTIIIIPNISALPILNSNLIKFFMHSIASTKQNGYYEYKPMYLSQIPLIQSSILEDPINQIITIKKQDPTADTSLLEAEIDQMVYELYGLTEEEIAIVEEAVG